MKYLVMLLVLSVIIYTTANQVDVGSSSYRALQTLSSSQHLKRENVQNCLRNESTWLNSNFELIKQKRIFYDQLKRRHKDLSSIILGITDKLEYLSNILNLFSIVHRLTKTWPVTLSPLRNVFGAVNKRSLEIKEVWRSGVTGLVRVQEIYNISTETLADGKMEGTYSHAKLTAGDCFGIALFYYKLRHHVRAVEWLTAALQRTRHDQSVSRQLILEYLHLAQCFKGDLRASMAVQRDLRRDFPSFTPSYDLLSDYALAVNESCVPLSKIIVKEGDKEYTEESPLFVANTKGLCRKEVQSQRKDKRLKCRLVHYYLPHLRVYPFKMEELHLDPPVLKFYNVLHESEMEHFKKVYHNKTRKAILDYSPSADPHRDTQYNAWILDEMGDPVEQRFTRRAARVCNLSLYRVEPTMLATYGLAGEIKMHKDIGPDYYVFNQPYSRGDYLTLMFYLNEPLEGGYTIFPKLNLGVPPEKGSALMWFNRYPDLSAIPLMSHSGCPILRGSKWIMTKWFHVVGQDFPICTTGREKSYKYFYL